MLGTKATLMTGLYMEGVHWSKIIGFDAFWWKQLKTPAPSSSAPGPVKSEAQSCHQRPRFSDITTEPSLVSASSSGQLVLSHYGCSNSK